MDSQGLMSLIHFYKGMLRPDCEEHLLWVTTAVLIARRLQPEDRARIHVQSTAHWMPLSGRLQSTLMGEVRES